MWPASKWCMSVMQAPRHLVRECACTKNSTMNSLLEVKGGRGGDNPTTHAGFRYSPRWVVHLMWLSESVCICKMTREEERRSHPVQPEETERKRHTQTFMCPYISTKGAPGATTATWPATAKGLSSSGLHDPATAIYVIPLLLSGELPKYTTRALVKNELLHGASFPGIHTVLLPSSLLREAVPVLYASPADHSHLCALPSRNGARRKKLSNTKGRAMLGLYLLQTNTMKLFGQPHLRLCELYFMPGLSTSLLARHVRFPLFRWVRHHRMAWCWFVTWSHDAKVIPPWKSVVTEQLMQDSKRTKPIDSCVVMYMFFKKSRVFIWCINLKSYNICMSHTPHILCIIL